MRVTTTLYELYLWCRVFAAADEANRGCQLEIFIVGCRRRSFAQSAFFALVGWSVVCSRILTIL